MTNTLYLPELREMLAENDVASLKEFCTALHPARTAEFMEGLTGREAWAVLQHAELPLRVQIFGFLTDEQQVDILEHEDRAEIAQFIGELPPDDRVDLIEEVEPWIVEEIMPLIDTEERRDIQRLRQYPEGTAGAIMTTAFARLSEDLPVEQVKSVLREQAEDLETIYYLYVVDKEDHLRGLISFREVVMGAPGMTLGELMERDLVSVNVLDDQEEVADKVARYDLLAIPVVDEEHRMLGIITHDDVIDVMREEATEDAHRSGAIAPLREGYLETSLRTLTWKRGIWLAILFFGALLTAIALDRYEAITQHITWLVLFIPLVISTGGNSGNQSATLVITALSRGDVQLADWWRVVWRELIMGGLLGGTLGLVGFFCALPVAPTWLAATVIPITLVCVVMAGTLLGSLLPLLFSRLGLDPAMMSNPFVAGIIDVLGIIIYMHVAVVVVGLPT